MEAVRAALSKQSTLTPRIGSNKSSIIFFRDQQTTNSLGEHKTRHVNAVDVSEPQGVQFSPWLCARTTFSFLQHRRRYFARSLHSKQNVSLLGNVFNELLFPSRLRIEIHLRGVRSFGSMFRYSRRDGRLASDDPTFGEQRDLQEKHYFIAESQPKAHAMAGIVLNRKSAERRPYARDEKRFPIERHSIY